jgi:hypothetical protein
MKTKKERGAEEEEETYQQRTLRKKRDGTRKRKILSVEVCVSFV